MWWLFDLFHHVHLVQGKFPNTIVVAVKQLFFKTQDAVDSFINEVKLITKLQHRNLVNLKGFCIIGKEMPLYIRVCQHLWFGQDSTKCISCLAMIWKLVSLHLTLKGVLNFKALWLQWSIQFERTNLVLSIQCNTNMQHWALDMLVEFICIPFRF